MTTTTTRKLPFAQLLLGIAALAGIVGFIPAQQANVVVQYAIALASALAAIVWLLRSRPRLERFNTKAQSGFGLATCSIAIVAGLAMIGSTIASAV